MLLGAFEHTIDDKSRLTLPAKFREALSGGVVLTYGMDGCVSCYPRANWELVVEQRLAVTAWRVRVAGSPVVGAVRALPEISEPPFGRPSLRLLAELFLSLEEVARVRPVFDLAEIGRAHV